MRAMSTSINMFEAPLLSRIAPPNARNGNNVRTVNTTACKGEACSRGNFMLTDCLPTTATRINVIMSKKTNVLNDVSGRSRPKA